MESYTPVDNVYIRYGFVSHLDLSNLFDGKKTFFRSKTSPEFFTYKGRNFCLISANI